MKIINKFLKRNYLNIVNEYGKKLASDETVDMTEVEKCHLAKLILTSKSESEKRVISLLTLADVKSASLIPNLLREIVMLTKRLPDEKTSQLILNLYSILYSVKPTS